MSNEYGIDFKNLKCSKLKELCISKNGIQTGPFGSQLHNEDYVEIGTPIITVEHLGENFIFHENTPKVSKEDAERLNKYTMQQGDIIFSRVGSVDRRAIVSEKETGWLFSGRCLRVRPNPECLDSEYLSYFFGLSGFRSYIRNIAVGATMPSINTKILSEVPIYYPELPVQKQIASHLKALDDKIRLNTQTNRTLEQIAQALFKSWFIDFDPVKAKAAVLAEGGSAAAAERAAMRAISGKSDAELDKMQQTQAQAYQQLATTAALFPGEMQDSELGEIPKGWEVNLLGSVTDYLARGVSPKYLDNGGVLVLNQKCIRDFNVDESKGKRHDPNQRKIDGRELKLGDILINSTGVGTLGRVAQVIDLNEKTIVDSHVTVIRTGHSLNASYLGQYIYWKQPEIEAMGEGSTGQTELSRVKLGELPILLPCQDLLKSFDDLISPLKTMIAIKKRESVKLTEIRDTLLPQLLSGSLPLPDEAV